jgi:hypothetical protein
MSYYFKIELDFNRNQFQTIHHRFCLQTLYTVSYNTCVSRGDQTDTIHV